MMIVRHSAEDDPIADKPVPSKDTDYLRVLRAIRNVSYQRIVQEVCDESADPLLYHLYARRQHEVIAALDAMCDAVRDVWEMRANCMDKGCKECDGSCTVRLR